MHLLWDYDALIYSCICVRDSTKVQRSSFIKKDKLCELDPAQLYRE